MKNVVYILIVFFTVVTANAQCAMCRAALESSDSGIKAESVNDGIVYLMIFPYLLVALIGYAIYRLRKKKITAQAETVE